MKYSFEMIGKNAGIIWQNLADKPKQSISELEKSTKLKRDEVLLAIGWLIKEDKLNYEIVGRGTKFYLK
ncbi:MAG: Winged helix-turn-helix domain [Fusobacteriaceae bacterium]|nr:Winged helix-turn-helix domain [Fusobacteriales bacterium]MDN5303529.1 Winged helix-turn-helix domain [Fusobacteriaceae bacterium]